MLIKEYRLLMPMTVEDYRIAQLYMIQKKSREESSGADSGIEIIENRPCNDGPIGKCQYTKKIYHIDKHLPDWLKRLVNRYSTDVHEEAWNAYPKTKTRYNFPLFPSVSLEIDTIFKDDFGELNNAFELSPKELDERKLEFLDIVNDDVSRFSYKESEDPLLYVPQKTGRKSLTRTWIEDAKEAKSPIMCTYKLCRINYNSWGFQARLENFIEQRAIRSTVLHAHKQAWCWQDEYYNLTMEDIRRLEAEAQEELARKMHGNVPLELTSQTNKSLESEKDDARSCSENGTAEFPSKTWETSVVSSEDEFHSCDEELPDEAFATSMTTHLFNSCGGCQLKDTDSSSFDSNDSTCLVPACKFSRILLVVQGGNLQEGFDKSSSDTKLQDFKSFSLNFEKISSVHYPAAASKTKLIQIPITFLPKQAYELLTRSHPHSGNEEAFVSSWFPLHAAPFLLVNSPTYSTALQKLQVAINDALSDFLSDQGQGFEGQVSIFGDNVGSLLCFDLLSGKLSDDEDNKDPFHCKIQYFFMCGSSVGLLLANQLINNEKIPTLFCSQVFNLFHAEDLSASRVEPFLFPEFIDQDPILLPKYENFPFGDGTNTFFDFDSFSKKVEGEMVSWGVKRLDYRLYSPQSLTETFSIYSLPHLFHSSLWQSRDIISFILREIASNESVNVSGIDVGTFSPPRPLEVWARKHTRAKLQNLAANHVLSDSVVAEGHEITIRVKFCYGALNVFSLKGEKVDLFLKREVPHGPWEEISCLETDKNGRIQYTLITEDEFPPGMYPVKALVCGDHSLADGVFMVLPKNAKVVVFSIDGSFAASLSISAVDPKVRPGAVSVARFWQDFGYIIVYVTGRPDMQKRRVLKWMALNEFPYGLTFFTDGLAADPQRRKLEFLKSITKCDAEIVAAYGSSKDISLYEDLGVPEARRYIIGRSKKALAATILQDGYYAHLKQLKSDPAFTFQSALNNPMFSLQRTCFKLKNPTDQSKLKSSLNRGFFKLDPSKSNDKKHTLRKYFSRGNRMNSSTG